MLLMIYHEHARQQFNLVAKKTERERARKKSRVHENAFAEGHVERHLARLFKSDWPAGICRRDLGASENQLHICYSHFRLIDQ